MFQKLKNLNTKTQSLLSIVTLFAGFAMMWGSSSEESRGRTSRDIVGAHAVDIDSSRPDSENNGKYVVAAGKLESPEQLGDEYLKPGAYLVLLRRVEMFQWDEVSIPGGGFEYVLTWSEEPKDFLKFGQPAGHENPLFKILPERKVVTTSTFGGFRGEKLLNMIRLPKELELKSELLVNPNLRIEDNKLVIPRDPEALGTNLGDVRISYFALPQGDYTVMATQADEMTLVGASPDSPVVIRPGRFTAQQIVENMAEGSNETYTNLLFLGGFLFFFGFASVLGKAAPDLDLRPKIQATGGLAVLIVSAGVTLVVMLLFWVFSFVG